MVFSGGLPSAVLIGTAAGGLPSGLELDDPACPSAVGGSAKSDSVFADIKKVTQSETVGFGTTSLRIRIPATV